MGSALRARLCRLHAHVPHYHSHCIGNLPILINEKSSWVLSTTAAAVQNRSHAIHEERGLWADERRNNELLYTSVMENENKIFNVTKGKCWQQRQLKETKPVSQTCSSFKSWNVIVQSLPSLTPSSIPSLTLILTQIWFTFTWKSTNTYKCLNMNRHWTNSYI